MYHTILQTNFIFCTKAQFFSITEINLSTWMKHYFIMLMPIVFEWYPSNFNPFKNGDERGENFLPNKSSKINLQVRSGVY